MDYEFLKKLNDKDYAQKLRKEFKEKIDAGTREYQKQFGFEWDTGYGPTHNNESDAFKHAYMSAVMCYQVSKYGGQRAGNYVSKTIGDFHEWETRNADKGENNMDLWNNEVGREVATEIMQKLGETGYKLPDEAVEHFFAMEIVKRMKKGDLITRPNDPRKFEDRHKYTQTISKPKGQYNFGKKGHWVTTKQGNHIFIED